MGETMGDGLNQRTRLEKLIAPLIPRACREEVLGDLHERNPTGDGYLLDAILILPLVIASRIRRTWEPMSFGLQAAVLYFSFWTAAFLAEPWFLDSFGLFCLAIPCAAALAALVIEEAYAAPDRAAAERWGLPAAIATVAAFVSQGTLLVFQSPLVLPIVITFRGAAAGLVWMLLIRATLPPRSRSRRGRA